MFVSIIIITSSQLDKLGKFDRYFLLNLLQLSKVGLTQVHYQLDLAKNNGYAYNLSE
jgi:hypothetical protein